MVSQLAWLDHDEQQRRRVMRVIDQFRDEGTIDELGLGSIRDTFAGLLLPGLSTLHTRARYMLFIPWLVKASAAEAQTSAKLAPLLRKKEYALIDSLLAGGETQGVIGGTARNKLQRLPSGMFWSATAHYGLRLHRKSISSTLRLAYDARRFNSRSDASDDPGARLDGALDGFDPRLPEAPPALLESATFTLSPHEAAYLRERICTTQDSSLFPWLFELGIDEDAPFLWDHVGLSSLAGPLVETVDHGRRFSIAMHGATILYNLLLARAKSDDERIDTYSGSWDDWEAEIGSKDILGPWDLEAFWRLVHHNNPRVAPTTVTFVNTWLSEVSASRAGAASASAQNLIRTREIQLKGHRARLGTNVAGVNSWLGQSGSQLSYNWPVAVRILRDIIDGCEN
ncbi:DUF6361 family protein [Rhodococcus opacus]|uniref:DUF6361 family protein n=1 Tax=Rhodococcus opacus TaxID=37919 RepID=UPI00155A1733|nr:DUF6361 family protein [Rhodococcus opacus]